MATHLAVGLRILVLAGGESAEREISLQSGAAVAEALQWAGHQIRLVDPARCALEHLDWHAIDACFVALHGGAGEDGRVQQVLERLGVPYTGSGPAACRLAMSKSASKQRFLECHVATPRYLQIESCDSLATIVERIASLGYPLIVKPDGEGSSLGVTIVDTPDELDAAVAEALRFDGKAIAETLIRGREFTVAVLGDRALPPVEIVTPERLFSYDAKYHSALTEHRVEFDLSEEIHEQIVDTAVAAARAIGTDGLARVDLMLGHDGTVWVLEVNTIPGMTPRSLAPEAALRAGLDISALCELLIRQCLVPSGVS